MEAFHEESAEGSQQLVSELHRTQSKAIDWVSGKHGKRAPSAKLNSGAHVSCDIDRRLSAGELLGCGDLHGVRQVTLGGTYGKQVRAGVLRGRPERHTFMEVKTAPSALLDLVAVDSDGLRTARSQGR